MGNKEETSSMVRRKPFTSIGRFTHWRRDMERNNIQKNPPTIAQIALGRIAKD